MGRSIGAKNNMRTPEEKEKIVLEKLKGATEYSLINKYKISTDPSENLEDEFEKLKQQYLNCDGTCHNETISVNSQDINIHLWLETIRHEPVENFVIIAVGGKRSEIIYKTKGDQCSNYNLSDKAIRDSIGFCILKGIKKLRIICFS